MPLADPERMLALGAGTAAIQPIADTVRIVAFSAETAPVARSLKPIGRTASDQPAWDDPAIEAVPDWDTLGPPQPVYLFDQEVQ